MLLVDECTRWSGRRERVEVGGGAWELRGRCQAGAVRIYYRRSGPVGFTLACGELKKENLADERLIRFARGCYRKARVAESAAPRPDRRFR